MVQAWHMPSHMQIQARRLLFNHSQVSIVELLYTDIEHRKKIRLIEGNAKCCHLKINLKRDCAAGVYMSESQNPIPHPHTVYLYTVYLFTQGRGGGVEPERRLEWQQFTKLGRKHKHD
jgi:hypothetical protein